MKNVKKIVGLLMVLALAICMTIPAYAETNGTITVTNADPEGTYTAYKIFDVVYDNAGHYAYTIKGGNGADKSPWFDAVSDYAKEANGLTLKAAASDPSLYTVNITNAFSAANFAKALRTALDANSVTDVGTKLVNGTAKVDLGYYFVSTTTGTVCNLTTTNPSVEITDKNAPVVIEKNGEIEDLHVGAVANYTITGEIPDVTGYKKYIYKIEDTMSEGLTPTQDVSLQVAGGVTLSSAQLVDTYKVLTYKDNGFVLSFDMVAAIAEGLFKAGDKFTITYTATVNEKAVEKGVTNTAVVTHSNDPTDPDKIPDPDPEPEVVDFFLTNIDITKVDGANDEPLDGAEFKLYRVNAQDAKEYYQWNEAADGKSTAAWVADATQATVVTTVDGKAQFKALPAGTYYLEETKAPTGYNILEAPFKVEITEVKDAATDKVTSLTGNEVTVANNAGTLLPSTGGIGTTIFYVLGTVLIAGAFILIVTKKRMSTEK